MNNKVELLKGKEINYNNVCKVLKGLLTNEDVEFVGELENLKLYDVSYFIAEKLQKLQDKYENKYDNICSLYSSIFEAFCDDMYIGFESTIEENNVKTINLGNTSSFHIDTDAYDNKTIIDYYYSSDYRKESLDNKKNMLIDEFIYSWLNTNEVDFEEEYLTEEDLNYLFNEFDEFKSCLEDIYNAYKYIKDFKKDQINEFKEWMKNRETSIFFYGVVYNITLNEDNFKLIEVI